MGKSDIFQGDLNHTS